MAVETTPANLLGDRAINDWLNVAPADAVGRWIESKNVGGGVNESEVDPINGNTTTHDTLWMGVPMVAMKGDSCVGRGGDSILRQLGHEEWAAGSAHEYARIAADLANLPERLTTLLASLRRKMESSRLCDGASAARDAETALRGMWRKWCEQAGMR